MASVVGLTQLKALRCVNCGSWQDGREDRVIPIGAVDGTPDGSPDGSQAGSQPRTQQDILS